ncbi:uncharacterized protein LOC142584273 [Dermacentor variabilis]|uniref:uncharacterized protein LOC142584273 n=1 Tax=Dermacentor variabilis TaxID=34621 RepID=UPI003F5B42A1
MHFLIGVILMVIADISLADSTGRRNCYYHEMMAHYVPAAQEVKLKPVIVNLRLSVNGSQIRFQFNMTEGMLTIKCPNGTGESTICCNFKCNHPFYASICYLYMAGSYARYNVVVDDGFNTSQSFKLYFFFTNYNKKNPAYLSVYISNKAISDHIGIFVRSFAIKIRSYPQPKHFTSFDAYKGIIYRLWKLFTEGVLKQMEPYLTQLIEKLYEKSVKSAVLP